MDHVSCVSIQGRGIWPLTLTRATPAKPLVSKNTINNHSLLGNQILRTQVFECVPLHMLARPPDASLVDLTVRIHISRGTHIRELIRYLIVV